MNEWLDNWRLASYAKLHLEHIWRLGLISGAGIWKHRYTPGVLLFVIFILYRKDYILHVVLLLELDVRFSVLLMHAETN